jgi:hypothetical protein
MNFHGIAFFTFFHFSLRFFSATATLRSVQLGERRKKWKLGSWKFFSPNLKKLGKDLSEIKGQTATSLPAGKRDSRLSFYFTHF